ncbi:hypothetical protein CkaCkLH20_08299 [Colletotrichum karsti]|uniref:Uncharacterized protein n=1 Tax=Colletotrichum karsti TaxID=1095194 RepID=A0A9P6I3J8_9PEZI|nr:uncharacterized protein CkaCkLH20_08299 [Colletotrichum karsti]KAF9874316.1 hypothetical protein CkaCkLH20_08299 [Colletotrichum karsti]
MISLANQLQLRRSQDDAAEPDPETNHLIPAPRKRQHRVRVQGRLAVVRSVSTVNLRPAASVLPSPVRSSGTTTTTPATPRFESGVAGSTVPPVRRRRSLDDADSETEEEHDVKETAVRDRQFRGTADRSLRLDEIDIFFHIIAIFDVSFRAVGGVRQESVVTGTLWTERSPKGQGSCGVTAINTATDARKILL